MSNDTAGTTHDVVTVGIDIGCESTKVVLNANGIEIVRNEVGGHTTPTSVAFVGASRYMGEAALSYKGSPAAVTHLNRILDENNNDPFRPFYRFKLNQENIVSVEYDGSRKQFDPTAIMTMFLGKISQNVRATLDRIVPTKQVSLEYVVALPPGSSNVVRDAVMDAAYAAGWETVRIVETTDCTAAARQDKFSDTIDKKVLVLDMGHAQTTVSILNSDDCITEYNGGLGAGSMDIRLWHHFCNNVAELKNVAPSSKAGYRLLQACSKLKHLLSQLPEGSVTVENINDKDVVLKATRNMLVELCQPEQEALVALLKKALEQLKEEETLDAVEVLGGACRVPWVKETVLKTVKESTGNESLSISHSLDDTSISLGASILTRSTDSVGKLEATDRRSQLRQAEEKMKELDEEMRKRAMVHNQIEAHVLEMRAAKHGKHGSLLPTTELDSHLDQAEEWLYTEQEASLEEVETKLASLVNTTQRLCEDYFKAVQQEAEAKELEMNQEAKLAQAQESNEEEEDHDNRRLPKKRRMEIVQKNKKEANELFADGNYRHAAARYTKALTHCSKFVDLGPDDVEEVNSVKLSLSLNLALAYIKLQMLDQALRVCNDALDIDGQSAKALYRRATVYYEKKQWDNANRDLQEAVKTTPDDKAIQKLQTRIDLQIKKQKAKEKKMAQKMFG